ncbi:hypothetical protein EPN44_02695 [bacterium]|nr:MAG: hypothetical protein EPN44_02695 [bacterium]
MHMLARGLPIVLLSFVALPAVAATMPTPSITILAPAAGSSVATSEIPVSVATKNFSVECAHVGQPGVPGRGHIHAMVDGTSMAVMTNVYCSKRFTISGEGLQPGKHTLAVILATDAHDNASMPAEVTFTYQPQSALPLPASAETGKPSLTILSPGNGARVGKTFDLKVAVSNFQLSCNLEGRPNVSGYGHLHVFVTQPGITDKPSWAPKMPMEPMGGSSSSMKGESPMAGEMKMMSMIGMIGMPCATTIPVDLSQWHTGKAKIVVMFANNDHEPTMGVAAAAVTVNVR